MRLPSLLPSLLPSRLASRLASRGAGICGACGRSRASARVRTVSSSELGGQLAHAVGGGRLVSAKQDVVSRLIHDAPSEGVAHPGGSAVPSGGSVPLALGTGQF